MISKPTSNPIPEADRSDTSLSAWLTTSCAACRMFSCAVFLGLRYILLMQLCYHQTRFSQEPHSNITVRTLLKTSGQPIYDYGCVFRFRSIFVSFKSCPLTPKVSLRQNFSISLATISATICSCSNNTGVGSPMVWPTGPTCGSAF